MPIAHEADIDSLAESCVADMGDIFWDYEITRVAAKEHLEPTQVAIESVKKTLLQFEASVRTNNLYTPKLRHEYDAIVSSVSPDDNSDRLVNVLMEDADWTDRGAREILHLAKKYGTSILRNALALAEAMNIEDGESGL